TAVLLTHRQLTLIPNLNLAAARNLMRIGGDLFFRTGLLMLFYVKNFSQHW
ncbi:MAG: hypothetical protein F6K34_28055, partial [Okeania sp. SIO4D6]|nr:hypothetical protein [Okeania sp. SIO4D6]